MRAASDLPDAGVKCPRCKHPDSNVVDSRQRKNGRVRRRQCAHCRHRFSTTEIMGLRDTDVPLLTPMVLKKNGTLEAFERKKIYNSIVLAVRKPLRNQAAMEEFAHAMEQDVSLLEASVSSAELGRQVLVWLRKHDAMGYLRYASVHEELNSPADFVKLIKRLP